MMVPDTRVLVLRTSNVYVKCTSNPCCNAVGNTFEHAVLQGHSGGQDGRFDCEGSTGHDDFQYACRYFFLVVVDGRGNLQRVVAPSRYIGRNSS